MTVPHSFSLDLIGEQYMSKCLGTTFIENNFNEKVPKAPKISHYNRTERSTGTIIGVSFGK